jgi:hypothetical protein
MEKKPIEVEEERRVVEKKLYTPPTLNVYGKLTELTASGTGAMGESGQNPEKSMT